MRNAQSRRIWRRVGWGALIGLGVLVVIVAVALWLGPPRDPKCFALDNEDFGLGFKVGDAWDPDAFEAAMKANGFPLGERSEPEDWAIELESQGVPVDEELTDYPFFSTSWSTTDGCLMIHLMSNNKLPNATVRSIGIDAYLPSSEWGREKVREVYREAREKYPDDEPRRSGHISALGAKEAATRYPQVVSAKGVTFISQPEDIAAAYGEPLVHFNFGVQNSMPVYLGDLASYTFFFNNGRLANIMSMPGYRNSGIVQRAGWWWGFLFIPQRIVSMPES